MAEFKEKLKEKSGQRRKRFLQFLRDLPMPDGKFDHKLKKWIPDVAWCGVFTREEISALVKHNYVTDVTARLLIELYYNIDRQDRHGDYRIEHHRIEVTYSREQLMELKRVAAGLINQEHSR